MMHSLPTLSFAGKALPPQEGTPDLVGSNIADVCACFKMPGNMSVNSGSKQPTKNARSTGGVRSFEAVLVSKEVAANESHPSSEAMRFFTCCRSKDV